MCLRLLHLHLRGFLDLLGTSGLGHDLLLHDLLLQVRRTVRHHLLLLHLGVVRGALEGEVALRLRLLGLRGGLGGDPRLVGLGFGDGGLTGGASLLDLRVARGLRGGDVRLFFDALDLWPAHVSNELVLVAHLFDGERDDFEAHLGEVRGAGVAHLLAHHLRLFDDLLDGELADDTAQMALHHQANQRLPLVEGLAQELLGGRADAGVVVAHLELRNGLDPHRDTLIRVEILLRRDVERHQLQREPLRPLDDREDERAAADDDARQLGATVDDQRLVRPDFDITRGQRRDQQDHEHDRCHHRDAQDSKRTHRLPPSAAAVPRVILSCPLALTSGRTSPLIPGSSPRVRGGAARSRWPQHKLLIMPRSPAPPSPPRA